MMKTQPLILIAFLAVTTFLHAAQEPIEAEIKNAVAWGLGPEVPTEEMRILVEKLTGLADKHMTKAVFLHSYGDNSLSSALAVGTKDDWNAFQVDAKGQPGWMAILISTGKPLVTKEYVSSIKKISFDGTTFVGSFEFEREGLFKGRCIFSLRGRKTKDKGASWRLMKMVIANRLTDKLDMGKVVYRH